MIKNNDEMKNYGYDYLFPFLSLPEVKTLSNSLAFAIKKEYYYKNGLVKWIIHDTLNNIMHRLLYFSVSVLVELLVEQKNKYYEKILSEHLLLAFIFMDYTYTKVNSRFSLTNCCKLCHIFYALFYSKLRTYMVFGFLEAFVKQIVIMSSWWTVMFKNRMN